jgi:hypothetical protein
MEKNKLQNRRLGTHFYKQKNRYNYELLVDENVANILGKKLLNTSTMFLSIGIVPQKSKPTP